MNNSKEFLGTEPIGKLLFKLAVPSVIAQIVNMLYNLVDRVYIGHMQPVETVGKLALTGVGVCLPIIMVISAFAALMAMGGAPRASIEEGRGNLAESERIMGNSMTMLVAASVVLTVVSLGTRVVLAYALSAIPAIGVTGIWWSVPIGWFLADAVGGVYYWMKKKALFEMK